MKLIRKFLLTQVILYMALATLYSQSNPCANGSLEFGDATNWQGWHGNYYDENKKMANGFNAPFHNILQTTTTNPIQPDFWGHFNPIYEGNYSLKIGLEQSASSSLAGYTFKVTSANKIFKFRYAVVLNDPGHEKEGKKEQNPYFSWVITKGKKHVQTAFNKLHGVKNSEKIVYADRNNSFFHVSDLDPNVIYREWTCQTVDLSKYEGQTLTIFFKVSSCRKGAPGHFAYAYIDGMCGDVSQPVITSVPTLACASSASIIADGSGNTNYESHYWSIEESDQNGGRNPSTEVIEQFPAQKAGKFDLKAWYEGKGKKFKCNTWYRIKLVLTDGCNWREEVKLLFINCPKVDAGPDIDICCPVNVFEKIVKIGNNVIDSRYTYYWESQYGNFTSSVPNPTVIPVVSTTYTLTVTDGFGCKAMDFVDVYVWPPFEVKILKPNYCAEGGSDCKLNSQVIFKKCTPDAIPSDITEGPEWYDKKLGRLSYYWSDGSTLPYTIPNKGMQQYNLTVTNRACNYSAQATESVLTFTGEFPPLIANNAIDINDPNRDKLIIREFGPTAPLDGQGPAYNAYKWQLLIFSRNGNLIRTIYGTCNNNGIIQAAIMWDGKNMNGDYVQMDTYNYRLYLYNCSYKDGSSVFTFKVPYCYETDECLDWDCWFGRKNDGTCRFGAQRCVRHKVVCEMKDSKPKSGPYIGSVTVTTH